jgi:hypothetical protein
LCDVFVLPILFDFWVRRLHGSVKISGSEIVRFTASLAPKARPIFHSLKSARVGSFVFFHRAPPLGSASYTPRVRAAGSRVFQTELGFPFSIVSRVSSSKGAAAVRVSLLWISRSAPPVPFGEISLGLLFGCLPKCAGQVFSHKRRSHWFLVLPATAAPGSPFLWNSRVARPGFDFFS